jgi:hypothetical protein
MINLLTQFLNTVDTVYGIYLDSVVAYKWSKDRFEDAQRESLVAFRNQGEAWTVQDLDQRRMHFGKGDPNTPDAKFLHTCTQAEYKARNAQGGANHKVIGNLCLVLIYQYWEDHYRPRIAECLGVERDEVRLDIMGDIRLLRQSIIHHDAKALRDVERCTILTWFKEGDDIFLTEAQFDSLIYRVKESIQELASHHSS